MTGKDLLMAMGGVDDKFIEEAAAHSAPRKGKLLKVALVAAVMSLLLAGCAYAVVQLQDLKLRDVTFPTLEGEMSPDTREQLSMQGPAGSPAFLATKEWLEFKDTYDPDNSKFETARYHNYAPPEGYETYFCYTPEMVEKLDEICDKYDLKPLGKSWNVLDVEDIFKAVGIDGIWAEDSWMRFTDLHGGCTADGSFGIGGVLRIPDQQWGAWFTFEHNRKGYFGCDYKTIGSIEDYDQWEYTMKDGTKTLLALAEDDGLIMVNREDAYIAAEVVFNDLLPIDSGARRKLLEQVTEYFDFTYQNKEPNTAILDAGQRARDERMEQDMHYSREWKYRKANYKACIYFFSTFYEHSEDMDYVLLDLNGDGIEELVTAFDGDIEAIITQTTRTTQMVMDKMWYHTTCLCEGNILRAFRESGPCKEYSFYCMEENEMKCFELLEYHEHPGEEGHWTRKSENRETELSAEKAMEIIGSYTPALLNWKPISEFPKD